MTNELLKNEKESVQLLDVRLADDYEAAHLEGAMNNPVMEVGFPGRLLESAPDKSKKTVVYGASAASHEAAAALEKLLREGYTDAHILEGGMETAVRENSPIVEGTPLPAPPPAPDGEFSADVEESRVGWTGRNLLNKHHGTVGLKSGRLRFIKGMLQSGEFALDLNDIKCADLSVIDGHDILIGHLRDDDFLDVANHPEAVFAITKVEFISDAKAGAANLQLSGNLSMRGQTHPIEFQAVSGLTPDGKPVAQAVFSVDRTRWGILYGSGKFFHRLAGHLVNDQIEFEVKIVAR
ncbi:MAG: YceI family protein [Armatimonadetes bacterium]|nr:YceI family protein [Akkermansiaceae bacterium]